MILGGVILFSSGCFSSSASESPSAAPSEVPVKVELYISRASLKLNEFEQYKFLGNKMFWECGEIRGGRPFARQQQLVDVGAPDQAVISEKGQSLFNQVVSAPELHLDPPGSSSDMFDPGRALATVQVSDRKVDVKTSFDALEQGNTPITADLLRITKRLRTAAGGAPCGNIEFYGLTSN